MGMEYKNDTLCIDKLDIGVQYEMIEDPEKRTEILTDTEGKIVAYRKKDGTKYEPKIEAGEAKVKKLSVNEFNIPETVLSDIYDWLAAKPDAIKSYDLPKNGLFNLVYETFYLTANAGYSDKNGVYPIQVYENNWENAQALRTCQVYYVKSSLREVSEGVYERYNDGAEGHDIALDFYASSMVKEVNGVYYDKATLVDGQPTPDSIVVTQIVDAPNLQAWAVNKDDKHNCVAEIDFDKYLSGTFYVECKFQGNSTLAMPKRNIRVTFYKKNDYKKKMKIKIGEMVRLSGFNIKANYIDTTRMKDIFLNRVFMAVWDKRKDIENGYPWIKKDGYYTEANGMIKYFPCKLSLGGDFYGLCMFGLKKDEHNYMLDGDDDTSGIFVSGDGGQWSGANCWDDEMGVEGRELAYPEIRGDDSVSVETAYYLNRFLAFARNALYKDSSNNEYLLSDLTKIGDDYYVISSLVDGQIVESSIKVSLIEFSRETAEERMDVQSFIDYFIGCQVFALGDNYCHNTILYTGRNKSKFNIFFYDLDRGISTDNHDVQDTWGHSAIWDNLLDVFSDDFYQRYKELRKAILNKEYLVKLHDDIYNDIPTEWFNEESEKWGQSMTSLSDTLKAMDGRFKWMDNEYFNIKN